MPLATPYGIAVPRSRRPLEEPVRPIASALHLPVEHVASIDASHERCAALGLSRFIQPDLSLAGAADLAVALERSQRLHARAAPVMKILFDQIARTESMVVLCDSAGTIIHAIGDDDFLGRASKVALQAGADWSESSKGTNAIGTALVAEMPTLVHADEHFMHANHFLTCSAAPILDPRGNILGVLDVTGDRQSFHPHTMALVRMSARMIENHWLSDDYRDVMRVHFHNRHEFIDTLMEGILAVTPDGRIVGANRGALEQLGMNSVSLRKHTLASLFGATVGTLVERFRSPMATPLMVRTGTGRQFSVVARCNWPVWQPNAGPSGGSHPNPLPRAGEGASLAPPAPSPDVAATAAAAAATVAAARAPAHSSPDTAVPASPREGVSAQGLGDPQMAAIAAKVRRVLDRDIPVLIVGEAGTGKEKLARAIHQESQRAGRPFVAVNCAALPDTPVEVELFGCEAGVYCGVRRKASVGKIVQADGGTLFLDEVGELPLGVQGQLLRVLQKRGAVPLGGSAAAAVDIAIVCATRHNLREKIAAQAFREDLYWCLNGLALRLPPLRERGDLAALAAGIVARESGSQPLELSAEVSRLLAAYPWPGNVRQLVNVLRTACLLAAGERTITPDHLPDDFTDDERAGVSVASRATAPAPPAAGGASQADAGPAPAQSLEAVEFDAVRRALDTAGGNLSEAARSLGISRNRIYRKLRAHAARG